MKKIYLLIAMTISLFLLVLFFSMPENKENGIIRIGHTTTPYLAALFTAFDQGIFEDKNLNVELKQFGSSTDAGYALLANKIDIVFIEPSRAFRLINENDTLGIKIAGTLTFPFGATLVLREDLELRIQDLEGISIAASSKHCILLKQFIYDIQKYGVDTTKINFMYMDFETMLPALEAKQIEAMMTRGSYALLAQAEGHKILYQNWELSPDGDPCCPPYLAQINYFMLVKDLEFSSIMQLNAALIEASQRPIEEQRKSIIKHIQFAPELLQAYPIAQYQEVGKNLKQELGDWIWTKN